MRIDDSLKLAGQIVAAWVQGKDLPLESLAGRLNALHQDVMRIQAGSYSAWQDDLPERDALDMIELEPITVRSYPPPQHPLADPATPIEERIAGTIADDALTCLECGKRVTLLISHLQTSHAKMPWQSYLDRHGLPTDYPTAAPAYAKRKAELTRLQRAAQREARGVADGGQKKSRTVSVDFSGNNPATAPADGDGELGRTG